jgi:tetratricopeptide (TPR) repeat protein
MAQPWRTVRVFISSTFRDMHAERDYLVKVVFSELRERCARRRLHLVDLDLRWGVTEAEAEQGKVLDFVLDEIERSRPFFIAILGERYGTVPEKLPQDTEFTHPWLRDYTDHSLTALEIVHGVLRNPNMATRSFFYFRDPQVISQVPESKRADFIAESPEAERRLLALKERIRASGRPVMEGYHSNWDDKEGRVTGLEPFGQRVLEDLWTSIRQQYLEEAPEADPLALEREMHEAFAEERSRHHVGRVEQAARLSEYVQGTDRRSVVITGESGCGKSAFLATWYRQYSIGHPEDFVLAYFIGASPDSTNHFRLLRNMCLELKRHFDLKQELPEDDKKLSETLAVLLATASQQVRRVVVILDALDQLSQHEAAHGLCWLLDYIPEKVRLVVSCLEGDCLDVLRRRQAEQITLPPLSVNEQRQIVETLLGEWRRKLDDQQMASLLAHAGVQNPLYLRVALEELRLFGSFEELTRRIAGLSENVSGLFGQVLARLEDDHGQKLVTEAFSLLGCSRYGLSESELLELLTREGEGQFPRALWVRLARGARAYLVQHGEFISFFHRQLADAVTSRYLRKSNKHAELAAYFEHAALERKLDEYPFQLQHAGENERLAQALSDIGLLGAAWERERKYEWMGYWLSLRGLFEPGPCYEKALETVVKSEGETEGVASSSNIIGLFLSDMGFYASALPFAQRSLATSQGIFGPDHPDVATSLNNLALLYRTQGRFLDAEPLNKRALETRERTLGPDHPDVAASLNNLAELYRVQGKYPEAEPLYKRALEIYEKALGADHSDMAFSLNNLAALYYYQGSYSKAETLYKRALGIREKALGPDHPDVATSLNDLAVLFRAQGKYPEAEPLYKRALEIYEKALGPDHPNVATSLNNLAELYRAQGKYPKTEPLYKRALEIYEKALGPDHPDVAYSLNNLAALYDDQGMYPQAEPLYKRALGIREVALGPDHPDVATSLNDLAALYYHQGKYPEAEPLYKRALGIRERALGPDHPDVAALLNNLAALCYYQGSYSKAETLYKRALGIRERALGPDHPDVAYSLNNLAALYRALGKYSEAETLCKRALEIREKALDPDHPDVAYSLNNLAGVYDSQGKYPEAEPLYRQALAISEKTLGHNHPTTKTIQGNLINCLRAMK